MPKRDPAYLAFIRGLPCCAPGATRAPRYLSAGDMLMRHLHCDGPVEAHHRTGSGLALKAPDRESMPLCRLHHRAFHDNRGVFFGWDKPRRKEWQRTMVEHYQALHRESET